MIAYRAGDRGTVTAADGRRIPAVFQYAERNCPREGAAARVTVETQEREAPRVADLRVRSNGLTTEDLASLDLDALRERAVAHAAAAEQPDPDLNQLLDGWTDSDSPSAAGTRPRRWSTNDATKLDDELKLLADVYERALAANRPPKKAVQTHFEMPASTAAAWIKRARDRGFITSPPPRRPGLPMPPSMQDETEGE